MQTNLLKDIKSYLKAAAQREQQLLKKQQELEEKVSCRNDVSNQILYIIRTCYTSSYLVDVSAICCTISCFRIQCI